LTDRARGKPHRIDLHAFQAARERRALEIAREQHELAALAEV
jgi:hypothetical protein